MCAWRKPIRGFYKVNVNGVFGWGTKKASVGCIMRNEDGDFYRGCGGMIGRSDLEFCALWAMYYGPKLAWENVRTKLMFETNAADMLERVMNPDPDDSCVYLIDIIVRIMDEEWESLQMSVIPPSANGAAMALADHYMDGPGGVDEIHELPRLVKEIVDDEK